jgi:hypothetical protein
MAAARVCSLPVRNSVTEKGGTPPPPSGVRGVAAYSHRRALRRLGIKKLRLTFLGFVAVTSDSSK